MVQPLEERAQRIVDSAVELAEEGGFEAVRLRDVAAHAGVALGTLYRRFRSKEDLLMAALEREYQALERRFAQRMPQGEDELERAMAFFSLMTRGLLRRPNLARALLKAAASGEQDLAKRVAGFHEHVSRMIVMSLRDSLYRSDGELIDPDPPATERERKIANGLELMWFALLVGWSGGMRSQGEVLERMRESADLILRGAKTLE